MAFLSEIEVTINGDPFRDFISINISQSLYNTGRFSVICRFDAIEEPDTFLIEQSQKFLGKQIVVKTKAKEFNEDETKEGLVFRGIITNVTGSKTGMADGNRILLAGSSPEILLNRKPTCRSFLDKTLKDVVNEILQPYDAQLLNPKVEPRNKQKFSYIVQYEESDLDFLRRLSIRYGEWFYYTGERLVFGELLKESVDLVVGTDTQELNYSLNINPLNFHLYTVDHVNVKSYHFISSDENIDSDLNIYGKNARDASNSIYHEDSRDYFEHISVGETNFKEKLDHAGQLQAKADSINLTIIKGAGKNLFIKPGYVGKFKALKERERGTIDYGEYIFTEITSQFDYMLNYRNAFSAAPSVTSIPENTDPYYIKKAHPQLAWVKDNKDPEKLGRIRVWFIGMPTDQMTPWINITTPFADENSGVYFVPTVNSAVLVGFEVGDIERPYCLGNLYDKDAHPNPDWVGNRDEGTAKIHAIGTITGNTIILEDSQDGEKIRIFDAGNKNEIVLDSANKHLKVKASGSMDISVGGTLKISAKKIEIDSEDLSLMAQKKIAMQSGDEAYLIAEKSLNLLSANELNIMAKSKLLVNSELSLEINSNAETVIKGGIVKIN